MSLETLRALRNVDQVCGSHVGRELGQPGHCEELRLLVLSHAFGEIDQVRRTARNDV